MSQSVANIPGGFAAAANLRDDGVPRLRRITVSTSLVVPIVASAAAGYWLLRGASVNIQNAALAVIIGVLLVTCRCRRCAS